MQQLDIINLLNFMPLNVYWKDRHGAYLGCNLAQAKLFGLKNPSEIIGKNDKDLASNQEIAKILMENDQQVIRSGTPLVAEEIGFFGNQKITTLSCKIPFNDDSGEIAGIMGISIDITAQKNIQEKLTLEKKEVTVALDNILARLPGHVYWLNENNHYLGCNDLQAKNLGLKNHHEIVGKTNYELPWANQAKALNEINDKVKATKTEHSAEEHVKLADGTSHTFLSKKAPLLDENGMVIGVLGISFDITERKKMEQEFLVAKEKAESANRAKTEFLANMSHDVKTPMTGVIGVAEHMMHDPSWCTPEKAAMIHAAGSQVLNFFNNCLELSKLEMSAFSAIEKRFSLKTVLEEIHDLFLPRAQSKNLKFTVNYDDTLPENFFGYRESIYRVILNLVGNALKFTKAGEIRIHIFLAEKINDTTMRVSIEVSDTGIGIPENKHQEIFEKLKRLTPSYQDKTEGSGIGLYIVDQYVKMMQGNIQVKSVLGEGSTFTVTLPLKIAPDNINNPPSSSIVMPKSTEVIPRQETSRVLLVEDNPLAQMVTKQILESMQLKVDVAGTGEEAVAMFEPEKYDFIYMDIGLPGIDGYQTTKSIREKEKSAGQPILIAQQSKTEGQDALSQQAALSKIETPIIALTGHGAVDVKTFCGEAGMQGVLSKPLSKDQAEKIWRRYVRQEMVDVPGLVVLP